ncbi:MAG: GNAT family N-acetyltransferase [candidate division Zixibacteria bacterium]|nr:GNAT family N-acetyltransferase [candidate division Zixibacteria bacterium]
MVDRIDIVPLPPSAAASCEAILRSLPQWFGIEEAIVRYRNDIERMESFGVHDNDRLIAFLTVNYHFDHAAEIHVMGIRKEYHRQGIGRAMVNHVESLLRTKGVELFEVKTLAAGHPDPNYAKTRLFYESLGFRPLEVNDLWGDKNPCLILVKHL